MRTTEMIFGLRAVIEAVNAGKDIDKILIGKDLSGELVKELYASLRGKVIPVQSVPIERINRITRKNHQGVLAFLSPISYERIENIIPMLYESGKVPFIVMLDGITDVHNFGAIARTCCCAGVDALIIPQKGSVSVTADAVKASAGALLKLPVCKENNLYQSVRFLQSSGLKAVAVTEKGETSFTKISYVDPILLILGSEETGISNDLLKICNERVSIPMTQAIASLNVSVAAGISIYECVRQRGI